MNLDVAVKLIALILSVASLVVVAYNTLSTARTNRARFWLELRDHIERHDEVHHALRPGGKWILHGAGPESREDWIKVEAYLGFFEHIEKMIQDGLLDIETFKSIYGYRLGNIRNNTVIVAQKFSTDTAQYYKLFLSLAKRAGYDFPQG